MALDHLSLEIGAGMFGLLGANGAGKTTLMRILAGVIRQTSGSAFVDGHDLSTSSGRRAVQQSLGYLPQELGLYPDLTAAAFLDYIAILKGLDHTPSRRERVNEVIELVALGDVAMRKLGGFSGGMKRRVGIAQALLGDPALLVVDEPTAGLDPEERIRFRNLLVNLGGNRTVLLSTHIVDDIASSCRNVAVMSHGRVVFAGDTAHLTDAARGNTWEVELPIGVSPHPAFTVVSALQDDGFMRYRVVSSGDVPDRARAVEPTLEDGYLALVRKGSART